tara:strand:- start:4218 stop:4652 length:435 start_codon:yes stop_codon:yes gene_type:complete
MSKHKFCAMDTLLNRSTDYNDEKVFSAQGLLTLRFTPDELKQIQGEIKQSQEELVTMTDLYNTAKFGNEGLMKANEKLKEELEGVTDMGLSYQHETETLVHIKETLEEEIRIFKQNEAFREMFIAEGLPPQHGDYEDDKKQRSQ